MSGMIGNRQVLSCTLSDHTHGKTIARDGGMVKRNPDVPILEPYSPLQNAWKSRFRMSRRQNPPGGKCSSWLSDADPGTQAFRVQGPAGIRQGDLRRHRGVQGVREERQAAVDAGVESRSSCL